MSNIQSNKIWGVRSAFLEHLKPLKTKILKAKDDKDEP